MAHEAQPEAGMNELRDIRQPGWLWADNQLIRRDGAALGAYGIAVYVTLCSFAGNKNMAWPSVATIAEQIGCSTRQVRLKLGQLAEMGWISIEHRRDEDGQHNTSIYYLLPTPPGGGPGTEPDAGGVLHHMQGGTASHAVGVLHHMQGGTACDAAKEYTMKKKQEEEEGPPDQVDSNDYLEDIDAFLRQPTAMTEIVDHVGSLLGIEPPTWNFEKNWGKPAEQIWQEAQKAGLDLDGTKRMLSDVANANEGWLRQRATSPAGFYNSVHATLQRGKGNGQIIVVR